MSCPPPGFDVFSTERSRVTQSPRGHSSPLPISVEDLERIVAHLLPTRIPTDLMSRRGKEAQRIWGEPAVSPLYEALTIWVMAAWPEQTLGRVDTMVRTAIAAGHQVREGRCSTRRLIAVVHKAGRRPEHGEVHRHLADQSASLAMTLWNSSSQTIAPDRSRFPLRWGGTGCPSVSGDSSSETGSDRVCASTGQRKTKLSCRGKELECRGVACVSLEASDPKGT